MVTVVDDHRPAFFRSISADTSASRRKRFVFLNNCCEEDERTLGIDLLVDQRSEFANVSLINKIDLVSDKTKELLSTSTINIKIIETERAD